MIIHSQNCVQACSEGFPKEKMCIVFLLKPYKNSLLIASNRDEVIDRKSKSADWWPAVAGSSTEEHQDAALQAKSHLLQSVFGGRDGTFEVDSNADIDIAESHPLGTWLAINRRTGRFGILTNVKPDEGKNALLPNKISRGVLIADYLALGDGASTKEYLEKYVVARRESFNGFNLILGSLESNDLYYYGNRSDQKEPILLKEGVCYALTNTEALYEESTHPQQWPKAHVGLDRFKEISSRVQDSADTRKQAFDLLQDSSRCREASDSSTIDLARDTIMVSPYQRPEHPPGKLFGTVTHTVIQILKGSCTFVEQDALHRSPEVFMEFSIGA